MGITMSPLEKEGVLKNSSKNWLHPPEKVSHSLHQTSNWEHLGKVTIANVWRTLQMKYFGWFLPLYNFHNFVDISQTYVHLSHVGWKVWKEISKSAMVTANTKLKWLLKFWKFTYFATNLPE